MSEQSLNNWKFYTLLIEMCSKSVAETVRSEAFRPTKLFFLEMDMPGNPERCHGLLRIFGIWKEISHGFVIRFPIFRQGIQGKLGEDGITVRTVLSVPDVNGHIFPADVFISEIADFTDT